MFKFIKQKLDEMRNTVQSYETNRLDNEIIREQQNFTYLSQFIQETFDKGLITKEQYDKEILKLSPKFNEILLKSLNMDN